MDGHRAPHRDAHEAGFRSIERKLLRCLGEQRSGESPFAHAIGREWVRMLPMPGQVGDHGPESHSGKSFGNQQVVFLSSTPSMQEHQVSGDLSGRAERDGACLQLLSDSFSPQSQRSVGDRLNQKAGRVKAVGRERTHRHPMRSWMSKELFVVVLKQSPGWMSKLIPGPPTRARPSGQRQEKQPEKPAEPSGCGRLGLSHGGNGLSGMPQEKTPLFLNSPNYLAILK